MAGQSDPQGGGSIPQQQDAFGGSLVQRLWPGSGYRGASQSPYLPVVQPLLQSYDSSLNALMPQSQTLGPAQIDAPGPSAPGQNGKGPSSMGALMNIIDPVGGKMMFKTM